MPRADLSAFAVFVVFSAIGAAALTLAPEPWDLVVSALLIAASLATAVAIEWRRARPRGKKETMQERAEEIPS
jgi:hypothetical protein